MDADAQLWLLVLASGAATYAWRGFGVLLSGRIATEGGLFRWLTCVAYAMIAGLTTRLIVLPTGILASSALADRLIACAVALLAYYACRRNLFAGVSAGAAVLIALSYARAAL